MTQCNSLLSMTIWKSHSKTLQFSNLQSESELDSVRNSCNVLTFLLYDLLKQWTSGRHMCVYRLKCSSGNGRHEQDSDFWHHLPSRPPLPCVGRLCVPCYTLTIQETCVGHNTCTFQHVPSGYIGYIPKNPMER